jgi:beta-lactamase class A
LKPVNQESVCCWPDCCLCPGWSLPRTASASTPAAASAPTALSPRMQKIGKIIQGAGPFQVYFTNLSTNQSIYRGSETMPAASMIKVFILAKAYEDIQSGSLRRNETFTLTPDNVVGGAGISRAGDTEPGCPFRRPWT